MVFIDPVASHYLRENVDTSLICKVPVIYENIIRLKSHTSPFWQSVICLGRFSLINTVSFCLSYTNKPDLLLLNQSVVIIFSINFYLCSFISCTSCMERKKITLLLLDPKLSILIIGRCKFLLNSLCILG